MKAKVYSREEKDRKTKRYFVYLYYKGKRFKRYADIDGEPFKADYRAKRLAERINGDIEESGKSFDPRKWFGSNNALAFDAYVKAWFDRKGDISPSYKTQLESIIKVHWIRFFKDSDLREIRLSHLEDFLAWLPSDLKPVSKHYILSTLKTVFIDAYRRQELNRVPPFPVVKFQKPEIKYLTPEEREKVIGEMHEADRPIFQFMSYYGLRPCMTRALMWNSICFEKKEIIIKRSFSGPHLMERTKNRRVLTLPLMPEVEKILRPIRGISGFVFRTRQGAVYQAQWLGKIWRRANKKAHEKFNVPIVKPYQGVKHSTGMKLINEGWTIEEIATLFGHEKLESTRRYAKTSTETLRAKLANGVQMGYKKIGSKRP